MDCDAAVLPSDEQLACRAQQGCATSFEQLLRRYQAPVLHFLRQRTAADAEDLTQDTFLRVYENLHRYRSRWRFATWLFTIARRVSINHHRRTRPAADQAALEAAAAVSLGPSDIAASRDDRRRLWTIAAEVLSEEEVTALWLHYVEEMPAKEIARVVGRTRVGVKTMMFRARKRLLPRLRGLSAIEEDEVKEPRLHSRLTASRATPLEVPYV